jgi:hypothetical protein
MKLFTCQSCGQSLYFENTLCERCNHRLGFLPDIMTLSALEPDGDAWRTLADPPRTMRFCDNATHDACNWLVDAGSDQTLCEACRHNQTIPDLSDPANLLQWQKIEIAKHRLFYSLMRFGLTFPDRTQDPENGLGFDFLADLPSEPHVMTGHDNGLITIALAEADDAERERRRTDMHEPYRSLLGHFRHEVGHYVWDRLIRDGGQLEACRRLFGDDEQDYAAALERNYQEGPPLNWQDHFVSTYASSHAWEDWAETWAHYLHIIDTLETARAFGLTVRPQEVQDHSLNATVRFDPYGDVPIETIIEAWLPLTFAMNSLNRSMGNADLYPFVLSQPVIEKLGFVHGLLRQQSAIVSG